MSAQRTEHDAELDAVSEAVSKTLANSAGTEFAALRRAAGESVPSRRTIIPEPEAKELWPHPDSRFLRFPCALGCGWAHTEDIYADDTAAFSVPVGFDAEALTQAINEKAESRATALRERVESAIRDHFEEAHPGQEPPERTAW